MYCTSNVQNPLFDIFKTCLQVLKIQKRKISKIEKFPAILQIPSAQQIRGINVRKTHIISRLACYFSEWKLIFLV